MNIQVTMRTHTHTYTIVCDGDNVRFEFCTFRCEFRRKSTEIARISGWLATIWTLRDTQVFDETLVQVSFCVGNWYRDNGWHRLWNSVFLSTMYLAWVNSVRKIRWTRPICLPSGVHVYSYREWKARRSATLAFTIELYKHLSNTMPIFLFSKFSIRVAFGFMLNQT